MYTDARRSTSLLIMQVVPLPLPVAALLAVVVVVEQAPRLVARQAQVEGLLLLEREPELHRPQVDAELLPPEQPELHQAVDVELCPLHLRVPEVVEVVAVRALLAGEEAAVDAAAVRPVRAVVAAVPRFPVRRFSICCWLPVLM